MQSYSQSQRDEARSAPEQVLKLGKTAPELKDIEGNSSLECSTQLLALKKQNSNKRKISNDDSNDSDLNKKKDPGCVKRGRPKGRKTTSHPSLPRPRRPLSAYNIFFKEERKRIYEMVAASQGDDSDNATTFSNLAKTIASRWKTVDDETRKEYADKANVETAKYKEDMEVYNEKLSLIKLQEIKDRIRSRGDNEGDDTKQDKTKEAPIGQNSDDTTTEEVIFKNRMTSNNLVNHYTASNDAAVANNKNEVELQVLARTLSSRQPQLPLLNRQFIAATGDEKAMLALDLAMKSTRNGLSSFGGDEESKMEMTTPQVTAPISQKELEEIMKYKMNQPISSMLNHLSQQDRQRQLALLLQLPQNASTTSSLLSSRQAALAGLPSSIAAAAPGNLLGNNLPYVARRPTLSMEEATENVYGVARCPAFGLGEATDNMNDVLRKRTMELEAAKRLVEEKQYSHDVALEAASALNLRRQAAATATAAAAAAAEAEAAAAAAAVAMQRHQSAETARLISSIPSSQSSIARLLHFQNQQQDSSIPSSQSSTTRLLHFQNQQQELQGVRRQESYRYPGL